MPEPIPDTPEGIARAIMQGPPKTEWDYLNNSPASTPDETQESARLPRTEE